MQEVALSKFSAYNIDAESFINRIIDKCHSTAFMLMEIFKQVLCIHCQLNKAP